MEVNFFVSHDSSFRILKNSKKSSNRKMRTKLVLTTRLPHLQRLPQAHRHDLAPVATGHQTVTPALLPLRRCEHHQDAHPPLLSLDAIQTRFNQQLNLQVGRYKTFVL